MKKTIYVLIIGMLGSLLFAAPQSFLPVTLSQPDGSQIDIFASGDEFHNWLHDKDNYTIVQDDQGWYVYAAQDNENVVPTGLIVGKDHPSQRSLWPGINLSDRLIAERYERMASMRDYSNGRSPHLGQFNNLVVFIRFADDPDFSHPIEVYDDMFNDSTANANSMKNYFWAASYAQLTVDSFFFPSPNESQILSYIDSHPRNYYRKQSPSNPIGYNEDDYWDRTEREHTLLANAIDYVEDEIPPSLDVDGDNDGYVDNVCFIIQGSTEGWAELLWPHRWVLYGAEAYVHGAQVWDFNFQLENSLSSSAASVLSHEMFHSLSAPDLYRYNDNTITPIGIWDLMANGTNPPQHMSAWMKYRYGQWIDEVPVITESGTYTLEPVASSATNNIYRIPSWQQNESFILEYRKAHGLYDTTLPDDGLLVYRLNSQVEGNADGPPDELYIYRPGANDTTTNGMLSQAAMSMQNLRTMITEYTIPSGFSSLNTPGGLYLYNVGFAGDTISFDVRITDVQLTTPSGGEAWFSGTNKQITWISKTNQGTVKLEYSVDGANSWILIADNVQNDGDYNWTNIPTLNSNQCYVRITLNSNGDLDTSLTPFSIISTIESPETVYPQDMQTDIPTNPLCTWNPVSGASTYYFQLSSDPEFEELLYNVLDYPHPYYQVSRLEPYSTYFWRVASISEIGPSLFSETCQFETGALSEAPSIPKLISPQNMATNLPRNPVLVWQESELAEFYWLQLARDPYFSTLIIDDDQIMQTPFVAPLLEANSSYYWRVAAINSFNSSFFSNSRRFSTGNQVENEDDLSPGVKTELAQNFPNPFNPTTSISFSVKDPNQPCSLFIYNTKGQLVKRLFDGIPLRSPVKLTWDAKDENGNPVSSGIYLYRLRSGEESQQRKMLLSK
ncbi:MAG: hypothetical protein PWP64_105 [Candidatus Cloacimonadota bacterium]|nr:hypothetical protein [Candidatus Cloacimonadota bacterium]